jgi:peptide deformylase
LRGIDTDDISYRTSGKRPISAAASPLEQDLANEAKRFKADAAAAANAHNLAKLSAQAQGIAGQANRAQAILGGNTSVAAAAVLGLNGNFTPAQIAAMQQARAQQQMKKKHAEAQKRAIAPMPNTNGSVTATHMSTQQLQQAALTLQNPGAGQSSGTLTAQEGVLKMQALQNEVLRQQAVKAAALQAENANRPVNPVVAQPTAPSIQREMPVWRGRMMAVPGSEQVETSKLGLWRLVSSDMQLIVPTFP